MTTIIVAVIGGLAMVLAASIPAVLTHRAKTAAETASSTGVDVLAAVHRLEGKVDVALARVESLETKHALHEADHAPPALVPVPRTIARRARG